MLMSVWNQNHPDFQKTRFLSVGFHCIADPNHGVFQARKNDSIIVLVQEHGGFCSP